MKRINYFLTLVLLVAFATINAQEVPSSGLLFPRETTASMNAYPAAAAEGIYVYNTDDSSTYKYTGTQWLKVEGGGSVVGGDDLGNHTATQTLDMEGYNIDSAGNVALDNYLMIQPWDNNNAVYGTGLGRMWYLGSGHSSASYANDLSNSIRVKSNLTTTHTFQAKGLGVASASDTIIAVDEHGIFYKTDKAVSDIGGGVGVGNDNLGNHTATQTLDMEGNNIDSAANVALDNYLKIQPWDNNTALYGSGVGRMWFLGNGHTAGAYANDLSGAVRLSSSYTVQGKLQVKDLSVASASDTIIAVDEHGVFYKTDKAVSDIGGAGGGNDDLGNHTATQVLNMQSNSVNNAANVVLDNYLIVEPWANLAAYGTGESRFWYLGLNPTGYAGQQHESLRFNKNLHVAGTIAIGTNSPKSKLHVLNLPVYATQAAAIAGGLTRGAFYTTAPIGASIGYVLIVR